MKYRPFFLAFAPLSLALTSTLAAQSISIGLRGTGSVPTGAFGGDQTTANDALMSVRVSMRNTRWSKVGGASEDPVMSRGGAPR